MDLSMSYTNHLGERVAIADGGHLHLMANDLPDHEWSYQQDGQRVWGLRLGARTFTLPIGMMGGSLAERTRLFRVLEADALAAECGTLEWNGFALSCVPVAASVENWWFDDGIEERAVTMLAPRPLWCRDVRTSFVVREGDEGQQDGDLDYPHAYAHDWASGGAERSQVDVGTVGPAEWRWVVYGPASDPWVSIAGNRYEVDVAVPAGSRLELDTRDRTIRVVGRRGDVTNAYAQRLRGLRGGGHYPFQPLPRGLSDVVHDGSFAFDVVVHDERTEPAWQ